MDIFTAKSAQYQKIFEKKDEIRWKCRECNKVKKAGAILTIKESSNRGYSITEKFVCCDCLMKRYRFCKHCECWIKMERGRNYFSFTITNLSEIGCVCEHCLHENRRGVYKKYFCSNCHSFNYNGCPTNIKYKDTIIYLCNVCGEEITCKYCKQTYYRYKMVCHGNCFCCENCENLRTRCRGTRKNSCDVYDLKENLILSQYGHYHCQNCFVEDIKNEHEHAKEIWDYSDLPMQRFLKRTSETEEKLFLGIELEIECENEDPEDIITGLPMPTNKKPTYYIKYDGSLDCGLEICSYPATLKFHQEKFNWSKILSYLNRKGCTSHDNNTCGLHIHMSRNYFNTSQEVLLGLLVYTNKKFFERLARRSDNHFAEFKPEESVIKNPDSVNMGHRKYEALNWCHSDTIEWRMFKGTLNLNTLLASLEIVDSAARFIQQGKVDTNFLLNNRAEVIPAYINFIHENKYKNLIEYLKRRGIVNRGTNKTYKKYIFKERKKK